MGKEGYSLKVLPIGRTGMACVCAINHETVYESPHGAYLTREDAEKALASTECGADEIERSWTLLS